MAIKPTYEELEERVQELERSQSNYKRLEEVLSENQSQIQMLSEKVPLAYQSLDENGNFIAVNPPWLDVLGYSREEVVGKSFSDFLHPDWKDHFKENFPRFKAVGEILGVEFEMVKKDGSYILVSFHGKIGKNKYGNFQQTHCILQDITEQKRSEKTLFESQNKLATHLNNTPIGALSWDLDFLTTEWNPAAERIFGYSREEALGKHAAELILPVELKEQVGKIFHNLISEKGGAHNINENRTKNGRIILCDWNNTILKDFEGKIIGVASLVQDITERNRTEEELRKSEEKFRDFFENNPVSCWLEDFSGVKDYFDDLRKAGVSEIEGFFQKHPEWVAKCAQAIKIKDVNQATLNLHNAKTKEELFQGLERTFTPESYEVFKKEMIDVWNGKKHASYDAVVQTLDNEVRYVIMSFKIAPGHEESLRNVLVTFLDITDKTLAEQKQKKLEKQLLQSQKMEAIGTMAGGIAHDFNNMLAIIIGNADMALDDVPEGSPSKYNINQIIEASERVKALVRQILTFSRKADQKLLPANLCPIIKDSLKLLRSTTPATISIVQNLCKESKESKVVMADPTQINQLFLNLCSNAIYAMDEKGTLAVNGKIIDLVADDITHHPGMKPGLYFKLSISDTGTGITKENQERIFDPFYSTKGVDEGTGMGLSMVLGIVKSHRGFIEVNSELGEGTEFIIYFPAMANTPPEKKEEIYKEYPHGSERILFVDDEEMLAEMGGRILEQLGYDVTVKLSSTDALETFQSNPEAFDLVITDQSMPNISGADLAVELLKARFNIPVILCTGYSNKISEEESKILGIKKYLTKPIGKRKLAKSIREVLD